MSDLFYENLERLKRATNKEEFRAACLGKWGKLPPSMSVEEFSRIIHSIRERIFQLNSSFKEEVEKRQGGIKWQAEERTSEIRSQMNKRISDELKKHSLKKS